MLTSIKNNCTTLTSTNCIVYTGEEFTQLINPCCTPNTLTGILKNIDTKLQYLNDQLTTEHLKEFKTTPEATFAQVMKKIGEDLSLIKERLQIQSNDATQLDIFQKTIKIGLSLNSTKDYIQGDREHTLAEILAFILASLQSLNLKTNNTY